MSAFNMSLVLCVWYLRKTELWLQLFFLLNFLSKFIDTYRVDTVLPLILLFSEMLMSNLWLISQHWYDVEKLLVPSSISLNLSFSGAQQNILC